MIFSWKWVFCMALTWGAGGAGRVQAAEGETKTVYEANPGPWGELEYYHIFLEAPDSVLEWVTVPSQQTEWNFFGMTPADVDGFMAEAGMGEANRRLLFEPSRVLLDGDHLRFFPVPEVLLGLSDAARSIIYERLAGWRANRYHHRPVVLGDTDLDSWFEGSEIDEETIGMIRKLAYRKGGHLFFSDIPMLLGGVMDAESERKLFRSLTRTRTLLLRIRLSPDSDLEALSEYWSAQNRSRAILPIMESVVRTQGLERLDVAHLLPALPRRYLYTYPSTADGLSGRFPDSFWTAINFFEHLAVDRYLDGPGTEAYLRDRFEAVTPPYRFGDVLYLRRARDNAPVHACIYIADDIVYTKNGADRLSPWVLMKVGDLLAYHQRGEDLVLTGFRREVKAGTVRRLEPAQSATMDAGVIEVP